MRTFLTSLIEVSLTMSAVIALLLLLGRALEKRFAPQWRYWAWLVVALRLCVPVNVSLPRAPVVLPAPPRAAVRVERPVAPAAGGPVLAWNTSPRAGEAGPVYEAGDAPGETVEVRRVPAEAILFGLWCAGCAGFLAVQLGGYLAFRRRVGRWSRPAGTYGGLPVLVCDAVDSPLLMGLLRPVILVPAAGAEEFALLHEASHARRRDLWYKLLLVLCNAVHWFNPLAWVLRRAAARDVEIACDAALLKGKDEDYRRAYGQALLRTVAAGRSPGGDLTTAFSGGKRSLRRRFASLMDMSPKKAGRAALGLLCAAALLSGGLVACGGEESGLTVPEDGTVYAKFSPDLLESVSDDHETFTLAVVDYDRETGTYLSRNEVSHTFTMAEEVTVRHETTGAGDSVVAGTPGDQARSRELMNALLWPMLSSVYYEDSTWLLEVHLTDGKVDGLGWFIHRDRFPRGDLYDEESGLYYSPDVGAGTVVPEELRERFSVERRENEAGAPERSFHSTSGEGEELFRMGETGYSVAGEPDDLKYALGQQWFQADGVQFLEAGEGEVYDPVSGVRLTLPGELTGGLVLFSARTTAVEIGESGRRVETDGGRWLLCLHREMLGQMPIQQAVAYRSGVFALGLAPDVEEPFWSFGWEGTAPSLESSWIYGGGWKYPGVVTLSDGARKQCEALLEAREDIAGSLDASASALLARNWVTGVEYLDLLPAEQGTVTYQNDAFGFSVELPAEAAEHLMAVTTDRGAGWVYLGTATLEVESSAPVPPELETQAGAMLEAMRAGRSVTFVDRRLMARLGAEYAPQALSGGWAGRVVVRTEEDAPLAALEELGSGGGFWYYYAPTFLTEGVLALAEPPVPEKERTAILRTAEAVEAAARALKTAVPPAEETRTPLERLAPDGLTAVFDGPDGTAEGEEEVYWYRLTLAFHFDGPAAVDLEEGQLRYQLEFEEDSPLRELIGFEPFTSGGRVEPGPDGRSWVLNFTMGSNVVTEAGLAQAVARDPSCTLRVTDRATGESRSFPMKARYQGGGAEVVYTLYAAYDAAENTLHYDPIRVDERDMSFEEPDGAGAATPLAEGVRLVGGYGGMGEVQAFLDSRVFFSSAPMGIRLTIEGGEIAAMEWVWLQPQDRKTAQARDGVVHGVDVEAGTVSGFWLDGEGVLDFDAAFALPVAEGCNIQLLDGAGRYGEPVGLQELEARIAPLSSWGLSCELSLLDGAVCGIVEAG